MASAGSSRWIDPERTMTGIEGNRQRTTDMDSTPDMRGICRSEIMTVGSRSQSFYQTVDSVLSLFCIETRFFQLRGEKVSKGGIVVHQQNSICGIVAHNVLLDRPGATMLAALHFINRRQFTCLYRMAHASGQHCSLRFMRGDQRLGPVGITGDVPGRLVGGGPITAAASVMGKLTTPGGLRKTRPSG